MSDFRLRVFAAVARHLSFTKAGQELFISQPAVTKHIRELEAQYGQRLLERRGSKVLLTEAGRLLLGHAEAVAASAQALDEQLHGLRDPNEAAGRLRLGASTTLSQYVLPAWLPAFQARYPRVQLSLLSGNSERIAEALLRGELDLGFVEGRSRSRDLHYELLLPDELVAVRRAAPAGPPLPPAAGRCPGPSAGAARARLGHARKCWNLPCASAKSSSAPCAWPATSVAPRPSRATSKPRPRRWASCRARP
ncbi:MAG: LysR family transcriptional regulator [Hymenobacter sp.]